MTTCKVCGRELKDPKSILLEIGPVCRITTKTLNASDDNMDLFGASI